MSLEDCLNEIIQRLNGVEKRLEKVEQNNKSTMDSAGKVSNECERAGSV